MPELLHIILKLAISLITIIVLIRLMGKKELKQQTPLDYSLLVILGGVVSILVTGSQYSWIECVVIIIAWGAMIFIMDYLKVSIPGFNKIIQGEPMVIINKGEIIQEVMDRERMTDDELRMSLRESGVFDPTDVEIGVLEINGNISVSKKKEDLIDHQKQDV
jgi:uncharacterized membrane protein YcaP (DUF421 family)